MKIKITKEKHGWVATAEDQHGNTSAGESSISEFIAGMNAAAELSAFDESFDDAIFRAMYANRLDSLEIALANIEGHRDNLASGEAWAYLDIAEKAVSEAIIFLKKPEKSDHTKWREELGIGDG